MRWRTLAATVLALTFFGAVQGFAATLSFGASTLSAGNAPVAACQNSGAATGTYSVAYDPAAAAYTVATVSMLDLDSSCAGKTISLTLTGTGSSSLATLTGTVPAGGGSVALTPGATIAAAAVTGVSVAILG